MRRESFQTTKSPVTPARQSVRIMHRQCVPMCDGRELLGGKLYAVVLYEGPRAKRVIAAGSELHYVAGVADGVYYTGDLSFVGLESCADLPVPIGGSVRR